MTTVHHIAKELGQRAIADALGVGLTAVNNAVNRNKFPASWFPVVRNLCQAAQVACPEDAFTFKTPSDGNSDGPLACQQNVGAGSDCFKDADK